jgi:arabinofuranosyltransferase
MNPDKKYILLLAFCTLILFISFWKVQMDDSYIFYSYAQNIAQGEGFVFNPGEKVNAATSPLYTLLLSGLYFLLKGSGATLPFIAHITGALFLFLAAYLLFKMFNTTKYYPLQFLIPLLFILNPLIRNSTGMEMFLLLFLIVLTFFNHDKKRLLLAAITAAAAVLTRFDAVLILIPIGIDLLLRKRIRDLILLNSLVMLLILPWFIFSYFYFGELLPSTVKIKLLQQSTGYWGEGLLYLKGILTAFPGGLLISIFFISLFFISILLILIRQKHLPQNGPLYLIAGWLIIYFLVYSFILNPPAYIWYYTPLSLLFAVVISMGIKSLFISPPVKIVPLVILMIVTAGMILPLKTFSGSFTEKYVKYKQAAEWLNEQKNEPVTAIDEVGVLRFYQQRGKVRDILGLVNPEAVDFLIQNDFRIFLDHYDPDYIIADYGITPPYLNYIYSNEFKRDYIEVKLIKVKNDELMIFKKINNL